MKMESEPFESDKILKQAKAHFAAKTFDIALREFSRLLTLDPNNLAAKLGAGERLLAMGNYALAGYLFWDAKFKTIDQADYERLKIGRIYQAFTSVNMMTLN